MVDVTRPGTPRDRDPSPEQLRYARLLGYGVRAGLVVLIAGFFLYASGALPALVPFEALPHLWTLPVSQFVKEAGIATGWDWLALIGNGDVAVMSGIVILAGISIPCLVALVPAYARGRDWPFLVITVTLIAVLILSASGMLVGH